MNYILLSIGLYFTYSLYKNFKKLDIKKNAENFITDLVLLIFLITYYIYSPNEGWIISLFLVIISFILIKTNKKLSEKTVFVNISGSLRNTIFLLVPLIIIKLFFYDLSFIPSSSMRPLLKPGSVIILDKKGFYNLPFVNKSYFGEPKIDRNDIVVFYSSMFEENLIKRVIGLPGDTIVYDDEKNLFLNGKKVNNVSNEKEFSYIDEDNGKKIIADELSSGNYNILVDPKAVWYHSEISKNKDCKINEEELVCKIPPHKYFVMGDNRDNSYDSRYFGFVDENTIIGKYLKSFF